MTGNIGNDNTYLSNNLVELDCDTVSEIFKKLKKTTSRGQAFEYKIDDNDYEKEIEKLSKSDEFIDKIKMYRLKQNMTMKYLARQIGKHDEVYRQYELKYNDIQDYKIAENIIKILGIENILELPDYFKIMKKYSKKDIIEIVDKVGKKQFSQETNIPTSTISNWKRTDINKKLSTYTYKKVVPFFNNHNILY